MKNNHGLKLSVVLISIICLFCLASCGKEVSSIKDTGYVGTNELAVESPFSDSVEPVDVEVPADRKIIETIHFSVQTKTFDDFMEGINVQIAELGGYIESSDVYGREMYSNENRSANLTVRIPSDKSATFSGYVSENSVVTSRSITTEDVTLSYVDIESRVSALKAEKESLEALLKKAESVDEIISVRDHLTDVIYEIESYESQLRTYDNLIDYTTVTMYVSEVDRTIVVDKQNTWQKIGTNLKDNFANVWDILVAVFIFLISAIPYLLPFIFVGIIVLVIVKVKRKKRNTK